MKKKRSLIKRKLSDNSIDSLFFQSFIGEYVEIICKQSIIQQEAVLPLIINGIILDVDDNFYYLSHNGQYVTSAVKKNDVVTIEIMENKTFADELLEQVKVPESKEEGN